MEDLQPQTTFDRSIRWNIKSLEEKIDTARVYVKNLEEVFYKEFRTEYCHIDTNRENVTVTLHLLELTQDDILKLNRIATLYTIEPAGCDVVSVQILKFKGAEE